MMLPSSVIPFPQASGEQGSVMLAPHHDETSFNASSGSTESLHQRKHSEDRRDSLRHLHLPNDSSASNFSSNTGESLPSIRNLLQSIGQDSSDSSHTTLRRSPSAPGNSKYYTTSMDHHRQSSNHTAHSDASSSSETLQVRLAHSRPMPELLRSNSPQRRPPIASSAFAHSQYPNQNIGLQQMSHSDAMQYRNEAAAPSTTLSGPANQFRNIAAFNRAGGRGDVLNKKQRNFHSPSSSFPNVTSEDLNDATLPALGPWNRIEGNNSPLKRQSPPNVQQNGERAERSSAASRRRHTVGALEEPIYLREGNHQQYDLDLQRQRKITAESTTPRSNNYYHLHQQQQQQPPQYTKAPLGSENADHTLTSLSNQRYEGHSRRESTNQAPAASMHRLYLQHTDTGTGSLPSLSSSTSTASLVSERNRVHSMEEAKDRRIVHHPIGWGMPIAPPSQFYQITKPLSLNTMDAISSPKSNIWHSRSSTLDSIDTNTSQGSSSSQYNHNRPLPPPRSSSLRFEEEISLPWPATPTRRSREPTAKSNLYRGMEMSVDRERERRKYESLREGTCYPHDVPSTATSRRSSIDANNGYARPRAQTMTYSDRPIAPLPSHSQTSSHLYSTADSPYSSRAGRSNSSLSISSVSSLPQRVSSMEIDSDHGRLYRYQGDMGNSPASSEVNVSQTSLNNPVLPGQTRFANSNSSSGLVANANGSSAKYECGWCGKRFSRPSSLKIHHHSHTGEKPYACPAPNCGRTFSVQSNLRRHQKCHSLPLAGSSLNKSTSSIEGSHHRNSSESMHTGMAHYNLNQFPSRYNSSSNATHGTSATTTNVSIGDRLTPSQSAIVQMASFANKSAPFMQSRERRLSLQSSNAEEDEGEMEEEEEEEHLQRMEGTMMESGDVHLDKSMQDIQEEVEPINQHQSQSQTQIQSQQQSSHHPQSAFQSLLNPSAA